MAINLVDHKIYVKIQDAYLLQILGETTASALSGTPIPPSKRQSHWSA